MVIRVLRGLAAMILGYALIVVITTVGFDLVHGKGTLYGSPPPVLLAGAAVAVIAGLAGGFLAGWIGPMRGLANSALVLVLLTVDTIYVLFFFEGKAPFWFDLAGSGTLMLFTLAGGLLRDRVIPRRVDRSVKVW